MDLILNARLRFLGGMLEKDQFKARSLLEAASSRLERESWLRHVGRYLSSHRAGVRQGVIRLFFEDRAKATVFSLENLLCAAKKAVTSVNSRPVLLEYNQNILKAVGGLAGSSPECSQFLKEFLVKYYWDYLQCFETNKHYMSESYWGQLRNIRQSIKQGPPEMYTLVDMVLGDLQRMRNEREEKAKERERKRKEREMEIRKDGFKRYLSRSGRQVAEFSGDFNVGSKIGVLENYKGMVEFAARRPPGFPMFIEKAVLKGSLNVLAVIYPLENEDEGFPSQYSHPTITRWMNSMGTYRSTFGIEHSHYSGPGRLKEYYDRLVSVESTYFDS